MFALSYILLKSLFTLFSFNLTPIADNLTEEAVLGQVQAAQIITSSPSPTPDIIPTHSPAISPTPTNELELETSTPLATPTNVVNPGSTLLKAINEYRESTGLNRFDTSTEVCNFAKLRAQELTSDFSHKGFDERMASNSLPYTSYSKVAENIADAKSPERVMELWKNSEGHNKNLLSDATYACAANFGRFYVFESWTP